mgnify:CR=1 FL=1
MLATKLIYKVYIISEILGKFQNSPTVYKLTNQPSNKYVAHDHGTQNGVLYFDSSTSIGDG